MLQAIVWVAYVAVVLTLFLMPRKGPAADTRPATVPAGTASPKENS